MVIKFLSDSAIFNRLQSKATVSVKDVNGTSCSGGLSLSCCIILFPVGDVTHPLFDSNWTGFIQCAVYRIWMQLWPKRTIQVNV